MNTTRRGALLLLVLLSLLACGPDDARVAAEVTAPDAATEEPLATGSLDRPESVDVASWNVEWLGDPGHGPADEALQLRNASTVLRTMDLDLVGLVEVVSEQSFSSLLARLPGYRGLLVTDPAVQGGRASYGADEQKVALLLRDRFRVTGARVVLAEEAWAFAGRPPMEVALAFSEQGRPRTLTVVVAHFKAMADADGYRRRARAAAALKAWLSAEHPRDWVLVVGDFNDDLDRSTYRGNPSPFATLLLDPAFRFTTQALTEAGAATTVHFSSTIDHHLATASLGRRYVEGSARVMHPEAWVDSYAQTTSDHYPVLTRYDLR